MLTKAQPTCLFGEIPENSPNLEVVGGIEQNLKALPWASVWGPSGLVVDRYGKPLLDTIWRPDFLKRCPKYRTANQRFIPRLKFGTYFNTMLFWCTGYYHWICDVLPRIQRAMPYLPAETKFIIPEKLSRPFMDALRCVGVPSERCVESVINGCSKMRTGFSRLRNPVRFLISEKSEVCLAMYKNVCQVIKRVAKPFIFQK